MTEVEIDKAIGAFVNAESWDAKRRVVEAQQEILFRPETELVFAQYIEQVKASGKQRVIELLETQLAVLRACKMDGIAAAFKRIRAMEQGEE